MTEQVAFLETTGDRHASRVGGLTALERCVRAAAKAGAVRVIVAGSAVAVERALPVPVEYVAPGTPAPAGATLGRADVIAGIELVDAAARARAEWQLIRGMNKSFEGPVDALINWRFSMRITRVLSHASLAVTPNQVTIAAILVGICAAVLVGGASYAGIAAAGVLLEFNSILDSCDGELARLRFQYSKVGQWLDNLSDDIVDNVFIVSAGCALGGAWQWVAIGAACGRWLVSGATYISVYRATGTGDVFAFRWWFESATASADAVYSPKSVTTWLRSLGRRDTYVFVWMLACLAGFRYWIVVHGAVISAINVSLLVMHHTVFRGQRKS